MTLAHNQSIASGIAGLLGIDLKHAAVQNRQDIRHRKRRSGMGSLGVMDHSKNLNTDAPGKLFSGLVFHGRPQFLAAENRMQRDIARGWLPLVKFDNARSPRWYSPREPRPTNPNEKLGRILWGIPETRPAHERPWLRSRWRLASVFRPLFLR